MYTPTISGWTSSSDSNNCKGSSGKFSIVVPNRLNFDHRMSTIFERAMFREVRLYDDFIPLTFRSGQHRHRVIRCKDRHCVHCLHRSATNTYSALGQLRTSATFASANNVQGQIMIDHVCLHLSIRRPRPPGGYTQFRFMWPISDPRFV
jgi:hypothetical protein